jgi:hypothetical protein
MCQVRQSICATREHHSKRKIPIICIRNVYGSNPKRITKLHTFGILVIVDNHEDKRIRNKLADWGKGVTFAGYSDFHK